MDRNLVPLDLNLTFPYITSSNISNHYFVPLTPAIATCSAYIFLILFGHLCWFILFPYLRRNWNPRRKMMSNVHIECITLIIFHLVYRMPCIVHMFSFDNPYINRKDYGYLVLPIILVLGFTIVKTARYCFRRIVYPQDFDREDMLIVEPSEFHEETLDLPYQHRVSRRIQQHYFTQGEYQSIDGQEGCQNPYNIPRLQETQTILNFLILFSVISLILAFVNPDTCFQKDPIPRLFLCATYAGHLTSVVHKRIKYNGIEKPYTVAVFTVIILAIGFCMFHIYEWHETTKVGVITVFEIIFGAAALYIIIFKILLRYRPTKSDLLRTILSCLPYLILTLSTVVAGMKKVKVGLSLSKCT